MFRFLLKKWLALSGTLLVVACAAQAASAGVKRATLPVSPTVSSARRVDRAPTTAPPADATDADREAGIEWRFHAGSSIHAAPVVASDGTVYVGTGDGYVEAVNADGSLKWSYTVEGAVAWSPLIDAGEHVIVATSAQRLYSISASGLPAWEVRPPAHVTTELSLAAPGGFLFGATDGSVWAYSIHSTALWHAEIGGTLTGAPSVRGSHTAIGTSAGVLVVLDGAAKRFQAKLGARLRGAPAILGDGSIVALAGSTLLRLDSRGKIVLRRDGVDSFGVALVGLVAIETSGDLIALGGDGVVTARVPLPVKASAPPVEIGPGMACVGAETGELLFVGPGSKIRRVPIARAPLHRPVVDAPRGRVVVAAGSGTVAAVGIAPPDR